MNMKDIENEVRSCRKCELWKTRKNPVIGEGPIDTSIMLIGEAPGFNEDRLGRPFVGRAGNVLNEALFAIGLKRDDVYITNILKCRPPGNRNPRLEEIEKCTPYLDRQVEIIKPRIICTLGNFALKYIFRKFGFTAEPVSKIHGKIFKSENITVIPMYHPASAVYNPNLKQIIINDFMKLKEVLNENSNTC